MLEPSLPFYLTLFGATKMGAISVPPPGGGVTRTL